jgi:aldehyde dehydrogenase (NAD+)
MSQQEAEKLPAELLSRSPIDGFPLGSVTVRPIEACADVLATAQRAFEEWRTVPAP